MVNMVCMEKNHLSIKFAIISAGANIYLTTDGEGKGGSGASHEYAWQSNGFSSVFHEMSFQCEILLVCVCVFVCGVYG